MASKRRRRNPTAAEEGKIAEPTIAAHVTEDVPPVPIVKTFAPKNRGPLLLRFRDCLLATEVELLKYDRARNMTIFGIIDFPSARKLELAVSY